MRILLLSSLVITCAGGLVAQTLAPAPAAFQRVAVTPGASAPSVAPGAMVSLWADVTPKPDIHVYAPGAKDFQAVALILSPQPGVVFGKTGYPAGTLVSFPGIDGRVPVYEKAFRITQPLTLGKMHKAGDTLTIAGAVKYQACDDRVCFPPASIPVDWSIRVR